MATYRRIGRPLEAHKVRTPQDYLLFQRRVIKDNRTQNPFLEWPDPFVSTVTPIMGPHINKGRWLVLCVCMNGPSYDPDWQLACCAECGAIYQDLAPPSQWQEAERLLMARPNQANRNWAPGEPLGDLVFENMAILESATT